MSDINKIKRVENLIDTLFNTSFKIKLNGYIENNLTITDLGYSFKWDKTSKRKLGCCRYTRKEINLSLIYVLNNFESNLDLIEDTIRHEMAHAISYHIDRINGRGHGYLWKQVCLQVGAKPNRCKSNIVSAKSKWSLNCPSDNCDVSASFHRKPKINRSCSKCSGGSYNEKYKLVLIKNY